MKEATALVGIPAVGLPRCDRHRAGRAPVSGSPEGHEVQTKSTKWRLQRRERGRLRLQLQLRRQLKESGCASAGRMRNVEMPINAVAVLRALRAIFVLFVHPGCRAHPLLGPAPSARGLEPTSPRTRISLGRGPIQVPRLPFFMALHAPFRSFMRGSYKSAARRRCNPPHPPDLCRGEREQPELGWRLQRRRALSG